MLTDKELQALIESITDPDAKFWKGVLYGDYGRRKTTTALRCSQKRAILLHADKGWNVVFNHPDEFKMGENVIPVEYKGLSQVKMLVEAVATNTEPFHDVDLFILDTISQMQEKYLDFLYENYDYGGKNFREKLVARQGIRLPANEREIDSIGLPDYKISRDKMRPVIDALVNAPVNVMFLTHVREPNVVSGDAVKRPNVTEKVFDLLARDATFIGFMEKSTREGYTTDFSPTPVRVAKSQIASLTDKKIKSEELPKYLTEWTNS